LFSEGSGILGGHDVPREGRRPRPRLLDDVLEACVVQEQLGQHLRDASFIFIFLFDIQLIFNYLNNF
jgi:hypothetical protein